LDNGNTQEVLYISAEAMFGHSRQSETS